MRRENSNAGLALFEINLKHSINTLNTFNNSARQMCVRASSLAVLYARILFKFQSISLVLAVTHDKLVFNLSVKESNSVLHDGKRFKYLSCDSAS